MNMHEIIRNRRRELGLTQEQLAGKLGSLPGGEQVGAGGLLSGHHAAAGAGPDAGSGFEHAAELSGGFDGPGDRDVFEHAP